MKDILLVLLVLGAIFLPPGVAMAQSVTPTPACEDTLRTVRILAEQYAQSRQRTEIEAAQTMASLLKQLDMLKAENAALKKQEKKEP